jgi:hypothetical protein
MPASPFCSPFHFMFFQKLFVEFDDIFLGLAIQKPSRMHWMQRKTWAIPWMRRRSPAAAITVLNW